MLEVRQPLALDNDDFGSIRVEVSTLLMRDALLKSLRPVFYIAGVAVLVGVLVATLLSQALLRPIHVIRSGLTRLGRGEFGVTLDLPEGDEFGELGSFFNTVSRQLSADRTRQAAQEDTPHDPPQDTQTPAVEVLEDAVALFGPNGNLLFSNQPMGAVISPDAIGRPVASVLPGGHPYRTLVEGALRHEKIEGPRPCGRLGVASGWRERGARPPPRRPRRDHLRRSRHVGRSRRRAARVAEPGAALAHAVHGGLFTQARGARAPHRRHRARGEESAERDDDSPGAAADQDPKRRGGRAPTRDDAGGGGIARARSQAGTGALGVCAGRARAREGHRDRDPPSRRGGAGLPAVHQARGPPPAACAGGDALRRDPAAHRARGARPEA